MYIHSYSLWSFTTNYIDQIISEEIYNRVVKIKKWRFNWETRKNSWLIRKPQSLGKKDTAKQKRILAFQVQLEELRIWGVGRGVRNTSRVRKDAKLKWFFVFLFFRLVWMSERPGLIFFWTLWYTDCRLPISCLSFPHKASLNPHEDSWMIL